MKKDCIFIDVFTDKAYSGNQLAVFPRADGLTSEQMQNLAREINYSETTFIFERDGMEEDFTVRIFSVDMELPFAGHPVLGTAYSIMNLLDIWPEKRSVLRLKTGVGVIPLEEIRDDIWMTQNKPEFFARYMDKKVVAEMVSLSPDDIADDLPLEEVSTGNNILIVPVKSLEAMSRAAGHVNNLRNFFRDKSSLAPYLFTMETVSDKTRVHTRFFAPHFGIIEDAATGSAAGPLTAYLLKHEVFGSSFELENEQGLEMGRPSRILMSGELRDNKYTIRIGGRCAYVGRGEFEV